MIALLFLVVVAGCTTTTLPTVTGGHVQDLLFAQAMTPGQRYLVWSPSPVLSQYLAGELLNHGHTVVERHKLHLLKQEQVTILRGGVDADLLRIGQLTGANYVVVAERVSAKWRRPAFLTVLVRVVEVESGAVILTGSASVDGTPTSETTALMTLAGLAWNRAACREEIGAVWSEDLVCHPALVEQGLENYMVEDRPIWRELERME